MLLGLLPGSDGGKASDAVESYTPLLIKEQRNMTVVDGPSPPPYCLSVVQGGEYAPVPLAFHPVDSLYACHDLCSADASCIGVSTNSRPGSGGADCALVTAAHLSAFQASGGVTRGCLSDQGHRFYSKETTHFASSCSDTYDLIWVVDESGSIGDANWRNVAAFLNDATASLSRSERRVLGTSLVQYFGNKANALDRTVQDPAAFQAKVGEHKYPGQGEPQSSRNMQDGVYSGAGEWTNIEDGLVKALAARRSLPEDRYVVVVLVTNGVPNKHGASGTEGVSLAIDGAQLAARAVIAEANTTLLYSNIPPDPVHGAMQQTLFDRSRFISLRNMPSDVSDVGGLFASAGAPAPVSARAGSQSWDVEMATESDAIAAVTKLRNLVSFITLRSLPSGFSNVEALFASARAPTPVEVRADSAAQSWTVTMATEWDAADAVEQLVAFDKTIKVNLFGFETTDVRTKSINGEDKTLALDSSDSAAGWELTPILKKLEHVLGELVCATPRRARRSTRRRRPSW